MVKYHVLNHSEPLGTKIADLTHADTSEHSVTGVGLGLPPNTVKIAIHPIRSSGTGTFQVISVSTGTKFNCLTDEFTLWYRASDGNFYYALSTKNDDWDIYCIGYEIEQPERS